MYDVILKYNLGMAIFALYRACLQLNLKNLAYKNMLLPVTESLPVVMVVGGWVETVFNYQW